MVRTISGGCASERTPDTPTPPTPVTPEPRSGLEWFGSGHPLAGIARTTCKARHQRYGAALLGRTACAVCWELVIRADARFAALHDLPDTPPPPDPHHIDPIAVELACQGQPVTLNRAELRQAVARMRGSGLAVAEIAPRLRRGKGCIDHILRTLATDATEVTEAPRAVQAGTAGAEVAA